MIIVRTVAQLQKSGATLTRVARATGLHRATVFRILRSLTDERMLRFREEDRSYHIGPLAFELGLAAHAVVSPQEEWRGVVETVAKRTRLTSYLMARSNDEAVCLLRVAGVHAAHAMPVDMGQRVPLGIGAGGLVMLSALDDDEIRGIAAAHQERLDLFPSRSLDVAEILGRVAETRARGYSISRGTVAEGVSGVGVLIPGLPPHVRLAITISVGTDHIGELEAAALAAIIRTAIGAESSS